MKTSQTFKLIVMVLVAAIVIYNVVQLMRPDPAVEPDNDVLSTPIIVEEKPEPTVVVVEPPQMPREVEVSVTIQDPIPVEVTTQPAQEPQPAPEPKIIYVPQPTPAPPPVIVTVPEPAPAQAEPEPEPEPVIETTNMTTLEIFSPIPKKGLGREYTAQPEIVDESNYIELGLILRNESGENIKDMEVVITGTDSQFNKTLNGAGNMGKVYKNGVPESIHYYPFHYEFKTVGDHTITFTADGQEESVTVTVTEPEPA